MKVNIYLLILLTCIFTLINNIDSKAKIKPSGGVEGEIEVTLKWKGWSYPFCDSPPESCKLRLKVWVKTPFLDPSTGSEYLPMFYDTGEYDIDSDGVIDLIKTTDDVGSTITLGEFIVDAQYTQGNGNLLVRVINEPIDQTTGEFKAIIIR